MTFQKLDMDIFKEGSSVSETTIAVRAMNEGKILNEKVPREKYGQRLITITIPLIVVANEIRQLSTQSKETVPQIKVLTEEIKNKMNEINKESSESLAASQEQASATEEISASIEELSAMAN
ncbi:hypothetical protein [Clostridium sp. JS66]|uniref:hypothetical protein n=1 Tax=Clostridium sp. JS66 TaxID=3064705 RepID=UPI00298E3DC5|nr:hypothetical protein [Clostridium sp. JS66]